MEKIEFKTLDSIENQAAQPAPAPQEKPKEQEHEESKPTKHTDKEPGQKPAGV